jgi:hypothetical protein
MVQGSIGDALKLFPLLASNSTSHGIAEMIKWCVPKAKQKLVIAR